MAVIALIEDKPEDSAPMVEALTAARHHVLLYTDETSAVEAVCSREFDVILLDMELGTSKDAGHNILDHVQRKDRNRVVMISAATDIGTLRPRMLKMGAWDYLPKPLEPETLLLKVDRLLKDLLEKSPMARQERGSISWDPNRSSEMRWKGRDVAIPATACDLVKALVLAGGATLTYQYLMKKLGTPTSDNLRANIRHARAVFKAVDENFDAIRNVPRKGYEWCED